MGFFACFSRRPEADSEALQKCYSKADFSPRKAGFLGRGCGRMQLKMAERGRPAREVTAAVRYPRLAVQFLASRSPCSSADLLRMLPAYGPADVVDAFRSLPAGY